MHEVVRIEFIEGEAVVSHEQLAEGLEIKAKNVRELLQKHSDDFEQFGQLSFQTDTVTNAVGAVNQKKIYYLNEQQATLALTYFRNSDTVRAFKIALVKSFYKMKSQLQQGDGAMTQALHVMAESQRQMATGFETMAMSIKTLSDGQTQIIELVSQLQSNTPLRALPKTEISSAIKERLVCLNPESHDNPEEREMFTMNAIEILSAYGSGLTQSQLLDKSDYPTSTRTRRWLQDGIGVYWNMNVKPGRGYLYFL